MTTTADAAKRPSRPPADTSTDSRLAVAGRAQGHEVALVDAPGHGSSSLWRIRPGQDDGSRRHEGRPGPPSWRFNARAPTRDGAVAARRAPSRTVHDGRPGPAFMSATSIVWPGRMRQRELLPVAGCVHQSHFVPLGSVRQLRVWIRRSVRRRPRRPSWRVGRRRHRHAAEPADARENSPSSFRGCSLSVPAPARLGRRSARRLPLLDSQCGDEWSFRSITVFGWLLIFGAPSRPSPS